MISSTLVEIARWQFAISGLLHFLFIPLTLGFALLTAISESLSWLDKNITYQTAADFWRRLLVISYIAAFVTRLGLLFQFGMNGSHFSHYVGDVFALPLMIETLTSFFLATGLIVLLSFIADKLTQCQRLTLTWLLVILLNISAYWVMVANGWMQHPLGAAFNFQTMRIELTDFDQLLSSPLAISKFIHTLAACYLTSAFTVLSISAALLLKNPGNRLAKLSLRIAACIGLVAAFLVVALGDKTPNQANLTQNIKQAILFGENPATFIPQIETHIANGVHGYALLEQLRDGQQDPERLKTFDQIKADLGYGMLVKPWHDNIVGASNSQIKLAAKAALPAMPGLLTWSFRLMIAAGVLCLLSLMTLTCYLLLRTNILTPLTSQPPLPQWLLKLCLYQWPLPWLSCIAGWWIAEAGKQPWAVAELLPSSISFSALNGKDLAVSLTIYLLVYGGMMLAVLRTSRQLLNEQQQAGDAA